MLPSSSSTPSSARTSATTISDVSVPQVSKLKEWHCRVRRRRESGDGADDDLVYGDADSGHTIHDFEFYPPGSYTIPMDDKGNVRDVSLRMSISLKDPSCGYADTDLQISTIDSATKKSIPGTEFTPASRRNEGRMGPLPLPFHYDYSQGVEGNEARFERIREPFVDRELQECMKELENPDSPYRKQSEKAVQKLVDAEEWDMTSGDGEAKIGPEDESPPRDRTPGV